MPETITSHTPGPWVYSPDRHTHDSLIHEDKPVDQYGYYGPNSGGVVGSSEWTWLKDEDARLIAAAPDLLAALQDILPFLDDVQDDGPWDEGWKSDALLSAISYAETTIAAATGAPDAQ